MGQEPNLLFPYVLDILSAQPMFSETQGNILKTLKQNLNSDGIKVRNLKEEIETTLDVGKDLGILAVQGDTIRMPRLLKGDDEVTEKTHSSRSRSSSRRGRRGSNKNMKRGRSRRSHSRRRSRSRRHSKRS